MYIGACSQIWVVTNFLMRTNYLLSSPHPIERASFPCCCCGRAQSPHRRRRASLPRGLSTYGFSGGCSSTLWQRLNSETKKICTLSTENQSLSCAELRRKSEGEGGTKKAHIKIAHGHTNGRQQVTRPTNVHTIHKTCMTKTHSLRCPSAPQKNNGAGGGRGNVAEPSHSYDVCILLNMYYLFSKNQRAACVPFPRRSPPRLQHHRLCHPVLGFWERQLRTRSPCVSRTDRAQETAIGRHQREVTNFVPAP